MSPVYRFLLNMELAKRPPIRSLPSSHDHASNHPKTNGDIAFPKFMQLPPEIRVQIYQLVLKVSGTCRDTVLALQFLRRSNETAQSPIYDVDTTSHITMTNWHVMDLPNLEILLASKQIFAETFHIFYRQNTFGFSNTTSLFHFLQGMGLKRRQQVTKIFLHWWGPDAKEAFRLLKTCSNLKSITLTMPCVQAVGYYALREVRGLKSVNVCAVIHHLKGQNSSTSSRYVNERSRGYQCRCLDYDNNLWSLSVTDLEQAMLRPRPKHCGTQYAPPEDLFIRAKRIRKRKSEDESLDEGLLTMTRQLKMRKDKGQSTIVGFLAKPALLSKIVECDNFGKVH